MRPIDADAYKWYLVQVMNEENININVKLIAEMLFERLNEMPTLKAEIISEENSKPKQEQQTIDTSCWMPWGRDSAYNRYFRCTKCNKEIRIECEETRILPSQCPYCSSIMTNIHI